MIDDHGLPLFYLKDTETKPESYRRLVYSHSYSEGSYKVLQPAESKGRSILLCPVLVLTKSRMNRGTYRPVSIFLLSRLYSSTHPQSPSNFQ